MLSGFHLDQKDGSIVSFPRLPSSYGSQGHGSLDAESVAEAPSVAGSED